MATKLTKPLSRELVLKDEFGHEGPVVVTLSQHGLELRKKGTSRKLNISFAAMNRAAELPGNAPAKFFGNPLSWLVEP